MSAHLNSWLEAATMDRPAEIGKTIVIKGEVTAQEDIVVSGRVEGSISVSGHSVTVNPGADLAANVEARVIVVSGRVVGDLAAEERVILQATGEVEGSLMAPALKIEDGGQFRGEAETTRERVRPGLQLAS
jgi:cytoskeletal protein CcmA (bactofilin family)